MQSRICRPIIFHGRCRTVRELQKLTDLANSAVKAGKHASYAGTTLANLNKAFDDIQKQITELACTNVTISDSLSENVEMVKGADGNVLAPQVQIFDASGNPVNAADLGITASYDSASKSVKMQFPADYKLQEGHTYEVIAKIQPTETAYENTEHQATQIRQMQEPEPMQETPDSIRTKMNMQY